jgi:hypothetical protein
MLHRHLACLDRCDEASGMVRPVRSKEAVDDHGAPHVPGTQPEDRQSESVTPHGD